MEPDGTRVVALVTVFIGFEKEKHYYKAPVVKFEHNFCGNLREKRFLSIETNHIQIQ